MENFLGKKNLCESERERMDWLQKAQFPHYIKRIGFILLAGSILLLFIPFFLGINIETFKVIARNGMLISMLLIITSKDHIEDELTNQIRLQAFRMAFLFGVIFTFIQPHINNFASQILDSGKIISYKTAEIFPTLLFFLMMQILFFHSLKKLR